MNTIEIREKNPELIKRLRESVKAYMEWNTPDGLEAEIEGSFFTRPLNGGLYQNHGDIGSTYHDFIEQCVADDITKLQTIIKKGE